ncbi:hypothetical protein [Candidatus Binatus sp.]|uniref:hypothetical protein n=1 Tax=Candidatus Binatus sp. TaxID=2811406 RepID=UPI003CC65871
MIDFQLTPADENVLSTAHEQALIGQRYARYYDKHEDELEPEEFPEAKGCRIRSRWPKKDSTEAAARGFSIRW